MSWPFSGTINGTVDSQSQNLGMLVTSFTLVNREGTAIIADVYRVKSNGSSVHIMPSMYQIGVGAMYQATNPVVLLPTELIRVRTTGSCDYDFCIENQNSEDV